MRLFEVVAEAGHADTLTSLGPEQGVVDVWCGAEDEAGRQTFHLLVDDAHRQAVLDRLQALLGSSAGTRILLLPVDAVLPRPPAPEPEDERRKATRATREELYAQIERGARLDSNYLLLVLLSTLVAAIGLAEDNVAVVVGAMVIAPLLGPNIALAFATSLGDRKLLGQAFLTGVAGLGLALAVSLLIGLLWPVDLASRELASRTGVDLAGVALALASGAAAVLSLTTGLSSALVGVMVAVALLPPTATMGMLAGSGQWRPAMGAGLLLAVNIVCVILAAKLVFLAKGVRPRTWYERAAARQSTRVYTLLWLVLFGLLLVLVVLYGRVAA
ncbi:TIGR00341 family protein [Thiohalobacter sp.]|uniref:TIGR00341 family protein n=1 Tax=Thiohalobacter sp. TaxID=2025948 RepID=UPI002619D917|nr:TIGR00341 family protein [Thiohalobacter sp.]